MGSRAGFKDSGESVKDDVGPLAGLASIRVPEPPLSCRLPARDRVAEPLSLPRNFTIGSFRLFVLIAISVMAAMPLLAQSIASAADSAASALPTIHATSNGLASVKVLLPHTRFATRCFTIESGVAGPTVLVVGGIHGDEPAGVFAAEAIRHWRVKAGRLVVIPAANVPALAANQRLIPDIAIEFNNLNRNFRASDKTNQNAVRGELAAAIWKLANNCKPDWVLDLHEGVDFHRRNENSTGNSIVCFPLNAGQVAADEMIAAVNVGITNQDLKFSRLNPPVAGSFARATSEQWQIPSLILETTRKQPLATRVRQHEIMVHRLLVGLGMVADDIDCASSVEPFDLHPIITPPEISIALYQGAGTGGKGPPNLLNRLNAGGKMALTPISPQAINAGELTNYDVVIFAGGSASKQSAALSATGCERVREFVASGGGYLGICAGAYLATCSSPQRLHLINATTLSPQWQRGRAVLKVEITPAGAGIFPGLCTNLEIMYHNGPVVGPAGATNLPPYETLAYFRSETAQNNTPAGIMIDSPAIFAAPFQRGRVVCISPHPEQTAGLEELVPQALNWVAGKNVQ